MAGAIVTRFAPSPTGHLHIGHVHSALFAAREAERASGRFLLRMEDIDAGRCRPEFIAAIYDDLAWLGLDWPTPVRLQSQHMDEYAAVLDRLREQGLLYPCFCTRSEIRAEIERAGGAPHGIEGVVYPGICRKLSEADRQARIAAGEAFALRIDMARAVAIAGELRFHDRARGSMRTNPARHGDIVLARKDVPTSYHIAVTLDDHLQGVTLVTRGEDLLEATDIHRLLQALLGLDVPEYHHHRLLTDEAGRRFAKRDRARTIRSLRAEGLGPSEVRALAGFGE